MIEFEYRLEGLYLKVEVAQSYLLALINET